jgi:hypothetical protein
MMVLPLIGAYASVELYAKRSGAIILWRGRQLLTQRKKFTADRAPPGTPLVLGGQLSGVLGTPVYKYVFT